MSAIAHLIALISPGPDTAIIIRQVSLYGRIEGFKTAIGIGVGIYLHCLLAINGISLIIVSNDLYKFIISVVGSTYILYLGINMLISKSKNIPQNDSKPLPNNSLIIGLITNVFNVKAFLFFVSLFTILIDNLTDIYFYVLPVYFALVSSLWFIFLSYIFTVSKNKTFNVYSNKYLSSIMSLILCFIGLLILFRAIYEYF
jgi:threonine/homoserine/homoserine lactone efflux protein|tara:strand:- start:1591 stop:2190 length:600 start_codon:yes stop_codon:yes gene_type:complete